MSAFFGVVIGVLVILVAQWCWGWYADGREFQQRLERMRRRHEVAICHAICMAFLQVEKEMSKNRKVKAKARAAQQMEATAEAVPNPTRLPDTFHDEGGEIPPAPEGELIVSLTPGEREALLAQLAEYEVDWDGLGLEHEDLDSAREKLIGASEFDA